MKRVTLFLLTAAFLVPIGAGAAERVTTNDCAEMGAYTGASGQFLVPDDDTVFDAAGRAVFNGTNGVDYVWVDEDTAVATVVNLKGGDDWFCGGAMADVVNAGPGDDVVWGNGGNDKMKGKRGNDRVYGGPGDDKTWGNGGADGIGGGLGSDVVKGGPGDDHLEGADTCDDLGDGDDTIIGGPGDDWVCGASGDDTLNGGPGDDEINSGSPDAPTWDGSGHDTVNGGPGTDYCTETVEPDTVSGCELP